MIESTEVVNVAKIPVKKFTSFWVWFNKAVKENERGELKVADSECAEIRFPRRFEMVLC